ncbi:hypothetical protein RB195_019936 [Necator americanus]|uniref:Bestrophin homolog n=1 Tax=Necator americanus TaxID=51031 RepID=A0ABR1CIE1_NECAM
MLLSQLENFRELFARVYIYDWVVIPLVYTQVSTISVYGYFAFALIGRQFPSHNEYREVVDIYVPIFTILQFLFFVGWLKVGEDLMFPFGADDEDFEFNYILERNLEMAFLIVDDLHNQVPPVYVESLDDKVQLMHTRASIQLSNHPQRQHLRKYRMKPEGMQISRDISTRSESFEVFERVAGLYNDLRWLADVPSQGFYPPRQVWYQSIDPEGLKGLVPIPVELVLNTSYPNPLEAYHKHSAPSAKASELSFGDFDYMANGPHKKKVQN